MLFDLVFAVVFVVAGAVVAATLTLALAHTASGRWRTAAAIAAWFAAVLIMGATGALGGNGLGTAGLGLAVLAPAAVLSFGLLSAGRTAPGAGPATSVLIAVHAIRVLGVAFVLLWAAHRLPAPFAPTAGWGDIAIGLTAPAAAWLVRRPGGRGPTLLWNLLGCLDLIAAVGLGATSSPGPAYLFREPPGSGIMTTLPWILIPAFLVPGLFALHVAIFGRLLRRAEVSSTEGRSSSFARPI